MCRKVTHTWGVGERAHTHTWEVWLSIGQSQQWVLDGDFSPAQDLVLLIHHVPVRVLALSLHGEERGRRRDGEEEMGRRGGRDGRRGWGGEEGWGGEKGMGRGGMGGEMGGEEGMGGGMGREGMWRRRDGEERRDGEGGNGEERRWGGGMGRRGGGGMGRRSGGGGRGDGGWGRDGQIIQQV